jgi:hypothetical protein
MMRLKAAQLRFDVDHCCYNKIFKLSSQAQCIERVQQLQRYYLQFLKDIPFNFMIGDDGFVYEGRGFRFQGEIANNNATSSFNDIGIFVAFIGTFSNREDPSQQGLGGRAGFAVVCFLTVPFLFVVYSFYFNQQPSEGQVTTLNRFLELSIKRDVLMRNYTLLLQDQLSLEYPQAEGLEQLLSERDDATSCEHFDFFSLSFY